MTQPHRHISVVIATYNRAPLLRETLASLQRQRYSEGDEVLVVDNASTDDTADVVARLAPSFPAPLVLLREPSPGKTPALITGLAAARGDVVALTDDDVLVAEDWIGTIRALFADPAIALVGGRVDPRWEQPPPGWLRIDDDGRYNRMSAPLALLHYGEAQPLGARTAVGANMALRADVLRALGGFAPHLGRQRGTLLCGEDHDLCQRAVAGGYRCEYRPELRVRHWVPAARTRLAYYVRWFFWCGVTRAVMEEPGRAGVSPYWLRRMSAALLSSAALAATGRWSRAAERLMDAAFAMGRIAHRSGESGRMMAPAHAGGLASLDGSKAGASTE
jgi:glycosyltransferase involved in cell wall biosynthesis